MSICKQLNQFFSDAFRNGDEVSFRFEKVKSFECKEQDPVSGKQQVDIKLFLKPADPPVPGDRFHDPYEKKLQLFLQPKTVFRSIRVDRETISVNQCPKETIEHDAVDTIHFTHLSPLTFELKRKQKQ